MIVVVFLIFPFKLMHVTSTVYGDIPILNATQHHKNIETKCKRQAREEEGGKKQICILYLQKLTNGMDDKRNAEPTYFFGLSFSFRSFSH